MQYLGGKWKIRKELCAFLQPYVNESRGYWEPFVGGLNILPFIRHENRVGSDLHPVIHLYKALQKGWVPPTSVSEEEYRAAKSLPDTDPLKHFIGFGCSFGGKYFGGYARNSRSRDYAYAASNSRSHNYAYAASNGLLKKMIECGGVSFFQGAYLDMPIPKGWVIYCDPPYAGTTSYKGITPFDHAAFWHWAWWASTWNAVFVSEYSAPNGWSEVWSIRRDLVMQSKKKADGRVEKLFSIPNNRCAWDGSDG